jgi:predicted transposase YdaD
MAQPYDVTTKRLFERDPRDWLELLGFATGSHVRPIDPVLPLVALQADKVVRVEDLEPWLFHVELQASYDRELPLRMLGYNALLSMRDGLPVESVLLLLRPEADGPLLTGQVALGRPDRPPRHTFAYEVVRLWQIPAERLLAGGLSTLPLAPLASLERTALPSVVRRVAERLEQEAGPSEAEELWAATYTLFGLRYPLELGDQLIKGVRRMRESVTYQAILAEGEAIGRARGERRLLLAIGEQRFGPPGERVLGNLKAIEDPERLEALGRRLLHVSSWDELLAQD